MAWWNCGSLGQKRCGGKRELRSDAVRARWLFMAILCLPFHLNLMSLERGGGRGFSAVLPSVIQTGSFDCCYCFIILSLLLILLVDRCGILRILAKLLSVTIFLISSLSTTWGKFFKVLVNAGSYRKGITDTHTHRQTDTHTHTNPNQGKQTHTQTPERRVIHAHTHPETNSQHHI